MKAAALKSLVLIASLCLCALPLSADGPQTGTIDGRVLDAQGGGLPGATVTLKGPQRTTTVMSDAGGKYRFALLQAGDFTVTAELEGLGSAEQTVGLTPGQRRGVDLTLAGGAAEEITVTGEAAQISKYDTGSVSSLQSEANENIAFANRNYAASVRALPGVVSAGESDALPMINGGITTETQVLIEGVDTSNTRRGGETRVIMPTSSLSETRIESGGFGAEYGRVTGGIINSTVKTGTNEFHGDFLYIGQNPKWRAEDNLGLERPDDPFASFETSLGGPIWREKAWFFAAYADFTNNSLDELRDGTVIDDSRTSEPRILKVNLQPSDRHQLAITEIDSRGNGIANPGNSGDLLSVMDRPLYAQVLTGTWSFAATSSTFVEVKASERKDLFPRTLLFPKDPSTLNPDASDNPVDNNFRYRDLNTNLRWNGPASGSGIGYNDFPRDTLGGSATLFKGNHELKFGVDFQDIEFTNLGQVGKEYRGRGYCFECPGGYLRPQRVRIFEDSEPSRNTGEELSVYAQDRIDIGDKWSLHLGLRLDEEQMWNDVGRQVDDSSDVAPRLTAVYDVKADGKLLVRASVGSYYQNLGLDFAFREFSELPTGQQAFTEFNWNAATQRYDRFRTTRPPPAAGGDIQFVDHARKDQITVGVDVQLSRNWVFKGGLVAHETDGIPFGNTQYLPDGSGDQRVLDKWPGAFRDYQGINLELNRRFRGGWMLRTNLKLGEGEGNTATANSATTLFNALGGVEVCDCPFEGSTDASTRFRTGSLFNDIDRLNILGMKRFQFGGKQALTLGGFLAVTSGRYWGRTRSTSVAHPDTGFEIDFATRDEARDGNQLETYFTLNLSAMYSFPIKGPVEGELGFEASNITEEDEVLLVNSLEGITAASSVNSWQQPREFRLKVGIRF